MNIVEELENYRAWMNREALPRLTAFDLYAALETVEDIIVATRELREDLEEAQDAESEEL